MGEEVERDESELSRVIAAGEKLARQGAGRLVLEPSKVAAFESSTPESSVSLNENEMNLDTSGAVPFPRNDPEYGAGAWRWSALSPFQHGYVEAALRTYRFDLGTATYYANDQREWADCAFSNLAPETLAAMLADCAAMLSAMRAVRLSTEGADLGRRAWEERQAGNWATFPPVTLYLGDDGLIYQRPAPTEARAEQAEGEA